MSGRTKQTWSRRALIGGTTLGVAGLIGPGQRAVAQTPPVATQAAPPPLTIVAALPNLSLPFYRHMLNHITLAAAELPNVAIVPVDGDLSGTASATVQATGLAAALADGADGLILSPIFGNDVQAVVTQYLQVGVPVITLEGTLPELPILATIGVDDTAGGAMQGELLRAALPGGGRVFEIQGAVGNSTSVGRHAGFQAAVRPDPSVEVVVSVSGGYTWSRAAIVFNAALAVHEPPDAVVCANDAMALGIAHVASELGIRPVIIGFDALPESLLVIEDGYMYGTIEPFAGRQATLALAELVSFLRSGTAPASARLEVVPVPITAANLAVAERAQEISSGGLLLDMTIATPPPGAPAPAGAFRPATPAAPAATPAVLPAGTPAAITQTAGTCRG